MIANPMPQNNVITNGALMMRTRSEITGRPSAASKALSLAEKGHQMPVVASVTERAIAKAEVRTALQQWQLAQMDSEKHNGCVWDMQVCRWRLNKVNWLLLKG